MRTVILLSFITILVSFSAIGCSDDGDNTAELLIALSNNGALSLQQQQTVSTANSVTSAVAAATASSSMPALRKTIQEQKLVAAILDNGCDPVYSRKAIGEYLTRTRIQKKQPTAELAATSITITQTTGSTPNREYKFYGTIDGRSKQENTYNIGQYLPILGTCNVTYYSPGGPAQGTASLCDSSNPCTMTWTGSGSSSSFSGSSSLTGIMTYSNFGNFYVDHYSILHMAKTNAYPIPAGFSCGALTNAFQTFYSKIYKYAVIKEGSVSMDMETNFSGAATSSIGYGSQASFSITLNTVTDLKIDEYTPSSASPTEHTIVLDNVNYSFVSSFSSTTGPAGYPVAQNGSITLTFSGKVNDILINEAITLAYP